MLNGSTGCACLRARANARIPAAANRGRPINAVRTAGCMSAGNPDVPRTRSIAALLVPADVLADICSGAGLLLL